MAVMRRVAPFEELWRRRTSLDLVEDTVCHLLSLAGDADGLEEGWLREEALQP